MPTTWQLETFHTTAVPIGDSSGDGVFDSNDLVAVFQHGRYENNYLPGGERNELGQFDANWGSGDWNLDREFDSGDVVAAFTAGSYQAGATTVPEPSAWLLLVGGLAFVQRHERRPFDQWHSVGEESNRYC